MGRVECCAPEVLTGSYGVESDVWSIGVILYTLLQGKHPFLGGDDEKSREKVLTKKIYLHGSKWKHISDDAKDLVNEMLQRDPNHRISALDAISHSFIQRLTTDEMIQRYLKINKRNQRVHSDKNNTPIYTQN